MTQRQSLSFGGITWYYGLASNTFPVLGKNQLAIGKFGANNQLYGAGGDVLVGGGGGGDNFFCVSATDLAIASPGDGIDTITNYTGNLVLPFGFSNGVLSHAGSITGNAGNNILTVTGAGAHTLHAGSGNDVLVGSVTGTDRFVVTRGNGLDVVENFRHGVDVLELDGFAPFTGGFATVQAAMTQVGSNVVLNLGGGQQVILANASKAQFTAADFALPMNLAGFRMTFDDEFTTLSASATGLGGAKWRAVSGTLANNHEAENYVANTGAGGPFSDANGVLTITASPTSSAAGLPYTSGELNTQRSFQQTYGYFEMRAELPSGAGMWPAFWLMPADGSWPPELDVMEMLGSDPNTVYTTTHSAVAATDTIASVVADTSAGFHTYGVDWEPDRITFYFDGNAIASAPTPADMQKAMYMIVDLAVGGAGSLAGAATGETGRMLIDYVRAYASPTAVQPPLTLLNWAESVNQGDGNYTVTGAGGGGWITLGNGNQTVLLTGAAGTTQGSQDTVVTGNGNQIITTQGNSNTITTGDGASTITAGDSYNTVTVGGTAAGTTTIVATGYSDTFTGGAGSFDVHGTAGKAVVRLGDGNDRVTLGGSGNTVTLGRGTSVVVGGTGQDTIRTAGGADTITVSGYFNVLDAGAGMNFLNGGSDYTSFVLNGPGQGLDTITGFHPGSHDVLDLTRALAGLHVAADLSNLGSFLTAQQQGGNTTLSITPAGGSAQSVAVLVGVGTSVANLVAHGNVRVGS